MKPEIWTYACESPVGYTSIADNSGAFAAKADPDKRPRSKTATVVRQNDTLQTKYLDDAILPRHRFALPHEEATGDLIEWLTGGTDSEAIISPIPFATKVLCTLSPRAWLRDLTPKTLIDMQTVTQHRRTAEDHFEVVIRLRQSRNSQPADATLRLRAQALLKDILMSRLEVEAEINAHEYVHTRGFGDLGRALAASRALQLAFEGFRSVVPAARANVSVVLDSSAPDETISAQAGLSVEQKDLLDFAKPSQVLITQAFYDRIALYQPALRSSPLRAGVYEFLWTGEQRLNELQAEAEFMPTLIQPLPPPDPVAETIIVPAFKSVPVSRWKEPALTYAPALEPEPEPGSDDKAPARWLSTPRAIAVGSAVVILCAIGYLVSSLHFSNPAKPIPQVTQVKPSPGTQAHVPRPTTPPAPVGPTEQTAHPKIPPIMVKSPVPPPVVSRSRNCTIEVSDIPRYLNYAETNSSKGQYEHAISEYNQVLGCQPGNRSALDGLRRAQDAEKYSSR